MVSLSDHERQLLAELTKHPGWAVLKEAVEGSARKRADGMAKILLFSTDEIDPVKLAYDRGYWKAMLDLVKRPEIAAREE